MKDFLLAFLFNLIFSAELLLLAVIALVLHMLLGFPMLLVYILLGLWVILALLVTLGLGALSRGAPPPPFQKNINPYSKSTRDYTRGFEDNNRPK